ncbi:MAG: TonB-dependent receptor [Henriciella sp.]|nr:TonB-dependent receptor [Henriciella sp.]
MRQTRRYQNAILVSVSSLVMASVAHGQEATPSETENELSRLATVTVTAQGREQSLQDVPIAIAAIGGEEFQTRAILDIESLAPETPGVATAESPFQRTVSIRGVGSTGGNVGIEQSAPFFVDGVFGGRSGQFLAPFFDLDRVEVIRGPQAIFFGKNATAGAVSINTARPTDDFYASINAGYELENEGYFAEGVVSGPIAGDSLRGRLAMRYNERGDYLFDTSTGEDVGGSEDLAIRGSLEWDVNEDVGVFFKVEHSTREQDRRTQIVCNDGATETTDVYFGLPTLPGGVAVECVFDTNLSSGAAAGPFSETFGPGTDFGENDADNVALKIDWALGDHTLELLSGYSAYTTANQDGLDRSAVGLANSSADEDFEQFSQEIRLLSPTGGQFEYVFGALYLEQTHDYLQSIGLAIPADLNPNDASPLPDGWQILTDVIDATQESEAYSLFGQLTWNFSDTVRASVGGRFTSEEKDFDPTTYRYLGIQTATGPTSPAAQVSVSNFDPAAATQTFNFDQPGDAEALSRSEDSFDPVVTVQWDASPETMVYGTFAQGTKAGGFEFFTRRTVMPFSADILTIEEEEATNYELGFKSTLLNGSARLNGSIFFAEYDGLQNQVVDAAAVGFVTFNADAEVFGVELDGTVELSEALLAGGALSYLDTQYVEDVFFNGVQVIAEGNPLPFAPEWSAMAYVSGNWDLGSSGYGLNSRVQVNYNDEMSFDGADLDADRADAYTTLDVRIGLDSPNRDWELSINAKNVTDEDDILLYSAPATLANTSGQYVGVGRTVFLQARKTF